MSGESSDGAGEELQSFLRRVAEHLADRSWNLTGKVVEVSTLASGRVLLMGDAAHAVSPNMGQVWGCESPAYVCFQIQKAYDVIQKNK